MEKDQNFLLALESQGVGVEQSAVLSQVPPATCRAPGGQHPSASPATYFTADCFIQIGVRLTSRQLQKDQASLDKMLREALPLDPHREHGEGGVSVAQAR